MIREGEGEGESRGGRGLGGIDPRRERGNEGWRGFTKGRASDGRGSAPQAMEEFKSYMTEQPPVFEMSLPPLDVPGFIGDLQEEGAFYQSLPDSDQEIQSGN